MTTTGSTSPEPATPVSATPDAAITVRDLTKTFGRTRALDGFDLTVPRGQVTGFLGPNGAGKSTTIRVLLGLLRATSGTADVLGMDPWTHAVQIHHRLAYVPGDTNLWPNLTGGEAIDVLTRGERGAAHRRRREELIARFELDPTKRARTYSKGNRQKVALVAALSRDVDLYIMDEPTSGLDPLMEAIFTDEVVRLRADGRTVLLSSHILAEVEKLCDTVTIIRAGKDVESGTLAQLRHLTRSTVAATSGADTAQLAATGGVHDLVVDGDRLRFDVDDAAVHDVLPVLAQMQATSLTITPPSLEDLFLRHYGDDLAADTDGEEES
ncbi:ABC transporter ATP-binding protein [Brachybacterium vulturis]|uniref:ABC transporter ATP-binding protein n=1 Tax=Brachybacterium vulturis TaxID=2017484 RepID=A0A291GPL7_9MICO|nr:ABC transporter ATP-binding protein [Brachybacterium vulturis]ATG51914.1 ABC transporter ATP-binding protein [Brachybacterium vulturis]